MMFNERVKQAFLDSVEKESSERNKNLDNEAVFNTVTSYGLIFKTSAELEEKYQTDLHDFNIDQLSELFRARSPKTKTSARTVGRIITKYIDWAIIRNHSIYKRLDNNPLRVPQDYFNQFVPEQSTQYLSVEEIQDTIGELVNDQDSVIVALLFNGIQGKEASEIRNLTKDDVDFNKRTLRVKDDKTNQYRIVDLKNDALNTFKIIRRAYLDTEYIKKNGKMEYNEKVKAEVRLPSPSETPYIIKSGKTQKLHYGERASQFTVYNRLEMIRGLEEFSDYSNKLTTKNIVRSGMIFEAKRLLEAEGGELDSDKIGRVCDKFNVKNHWAVRDFLNVEVIESLYGEIPSKIIAK